MFSILPKIIHAIAYAQGAKTTRALQSRVIHWYLAFTIIAQLVIFPSLSTIFTLVSSDVSNRSAADKAATGLRKVWVDLIYFLSQVPMTYQQQAK